MRAFAFVSRCRYFTELGRYWGGTQGNAAWAPMLVFCCLAVALLARLLAGYRHTAPVAPRSPLLVAAIAFLLGGAGNTAFAAHSGSQSGMLLSRFVFGVVLAAGWLLLRRPRLDGGSSSRATFCTSLLSSEGYLSRRSWCWLAATAVLESAAVAFLVFAVGSAPVAVITVIGVCAPALVALLGRIFGLPRATFRASVMAASALVCAGAATFMGRTDVVAPSSHWRVGVVFAVASAVCGAAASVSSNRAGQQVRPAAVVLAVCLCGAVASGVWAALSGSTVISMSTLVAALFVAAIPGGLGKALVFWANARSAPQLVSAMAAMSVPSALLLGWIFLGQVPVFGQILLSIAAGVFASLLAVLRHPTLPAVFPRNAV